MRRHNHQVFVMAACGAMIMLAIALAGCSKKDDASSAAGTGDAGSGGTEGILAGAEHGERDSAPVTEPALRQMFDMLKKQFGEQVDSLITGCDTVKKAAAERGLKDAQLESDLKAFDAKASEVKGKISKASYADGMSAMNQDAPMWMSALSELYKKVQTRWMEVAKIPGG